MERSVDFYFLGLDSGSVSLNAVITDDSGRVLFSRYLRNGGRPIDAAVRVFGEMLEKLGDIEICAGLTVGSGKELLAVPIGFAVDNEIPAHALAAITLHPQINSIIEIGGQDSKFIRIGRDRQGLPHMQDHAFNDLCAAGTGAFLDQQAERMGLNIGEFSRLAALSSKPARIAGRCSVFAKTDMIHQQQKGTPPEDIAAGLCYALVRNYMANLCRGKRPETPICFQGGVAGNDGVLRAFKDILELHDDEMIRPENYDIMGALGAAFMAAKLPEIHPTKLSDLKKRLESADIVDKAVSDIKPLVRPGFQLDSPHGSVPAVDPVGKLFLGLDVGSVSTKAAVIDSGARLVASSYVPTAGRPAEAIGRVVAELHAALGKTATIAHAVCTGSGRILARELLSGGGVMDEISAQTASALYFFPQTDTIIEIGGQDSKYIRLADGRIQNFNMNRACAAGTGAFLEEQCGRLGIDLHTDFAELAFVSKRPSRMGSRCTAFMDSDLVHHLQHGAEVSDLCAGLAYAIGRNYLEKVVGSRPVGREVLFQGGVARNHAILAVFERLLGRHVRVPSHPGISGAVGAALEARREAAEGMQPHSFSLGGLNLTAQVQTFECGGCANVCEVQKITTTEWRSAFCGGVCGKYEDAEGGPKNDDDAFCERERLLNEAVRAHPGSGIRGKIGLPLALSMHDYLPFWHTYFAELGFSPLQSDSSRRDMAEWGLAHVPGEFCYPVKMLFGHIRNLQEKGIQLIFIPHLRLAVPDAEKEARYACPYTQAAPYIARAHSDCEIFSLEYPVDGESIWWIKDSAQRLNIPRDEVADAYGKATQAQAKFFTDCREAGQRRIKRLQAEGRRACVLVGRPYSIADRFVNLNLARRLRKLDIEPLPFDFMPLGDDPLPQLWSRIRWLYGRKLVQAARVLKHYPNTGAVILTHFGCGPDSFINQYLEYELKDTPHILLELDEHQGEAGFVTRLEAFARTFKNNAKHKVATLTALDPGKPRRPLRELTYYVPSFMDHSYAFTGALRASGCKAVLLPPTDDESWNLGLQNAYGRECHPFISFTGDLLKAAQRPDFVPGDACYFGPSYFGPCLLPQYLLALHLILKRQGLGDVTVMNIADPTNMKELGRSYILNLARGIYAIDRLFKWKTEIEAYEVEAGESERVHHANLERIESGMADGRFTAALKESVAAMKAVKLDSGLPQRPRIGIVGDVYTRVNTHSNNRLYERLRGMGFEVWTSCSFIDVSFIGMEQLHAELKRKGKSAAAMAARALLPTISAMRALVDRHFPDCIRTPQERQYPEVLASTSRYVSFWIDKALSLNFSRVEEFHKAGADGVINVMCHNCMLGNVTAAFSGEISRDMYGMPICNLIYEGLQSTHNVNRLEAFVHQVRQAKADRAV